MMRANGGTVVPKGMKLTVYGDDEVRKALQMIAMHDQLVEMLQRNLTAWDGEEGSVKAEHATLIADTRVMLLKLR